MKIYNVGLPRTGSTSINAALSGLGYQVAALRTAEWVDWRNGTFAPAGISDDSYIICTTRDWDGWNASAAKYKPVSTLNGRHTIFVEHEAWVHALARRRADARSR